MEGQHPKAPPLAQRCSHGEATPSRTIAPSLKQTLKARKGVSLRMVVALSHLRAIFCGCEGSGLGCLPLLVLDVGIHCKPTKDQDTTVHVQHREGLREHHKAQRDRAGLAHVAHKNSNNAAILLDHPHVAADGHVRHDRVDEHHDRPRGVRDRKLDHCRDLARPPPEDGHQDEDIEVGEVRHLERGGPLLEELLLQVRQESVGHHTARLQGEAQSCRDLGIARHVRVPEQHQPSADCKGARDLSGAERLLVNQDRYHHRGDELAAPEHYLGRVVDHIEPNSAQITAAHEAEGELHVRGPLDALLLVADGYPLHQGEGHDP
mmetsp:Transcript_26317/g.64974  ORF Transcript_26317/g.64974 Transcript_26317/m.64974 type:complete len:320 (+) Transcript_26317:226-1185(+)